MNLEQIFVSSFCVVGMPRCVPLALCLFSLVSSHKEYLALNPNGAQLFGAELGHLDATSPGDRNSFGRAFQAAGKTWSAALCSEDSDGDGQSNGFELGDECCLWTSAADCNQTVLAQGSISKPYDSASLSTRPSCNCSADAARRCACCNMTPCSGGSSGGGGGGGDDDDDDDDDDSSKLFYYVGGGAAGLAVLGLAAYCFWRQRKAAAAAAQRADQVGYEALLAVN